MLGTIDIQNLKIPPEEHELETARVLATHGKNIVFLKPSSIPDIHTPDISMDGTEWEIKCPQGDSKRTIEQNFRKAVKQSKNIIFDLHRMKAPESHVISQIEKEFDLRPYIKKMYIITKNNDILYYSR